MPMAESTAITVTVRASIMNQWGTKEAGFGWPDILSSIFLLYMPFSARILMVEVAKKAPENNPKPANKTAPLLSDLNKRRLREKLRQEQIPETMTTTHILMPLPP